MSLKKLISIVVVVAVAGVLLLWPDTLHKGVGRLLAPPPLEEPLSVLFVGDIMLDRAVALRAEAAGDKVLFAGVRDIFAAHDLVVANLEGAITNEPSVSRANPNVLRFTFDPRMAPLLADVGVSAVSLANNHTLDFGEFGFDDTQFYLQEAGIAAFGSPHNDRALATATTVRGKTVCFVGYHELFVSTPTPVVEKLQAIEPECSYSIVFAHWGVEYEHEPSTSQRELAHLFVDSGADLVIGAHPHIVQPVEVYKNVAIFYSLGNFIFDQDWMPEVRRGTMVSVEFTDNKTRFTVLPTNTYLEASLADEAASVAVLADLGLESPTFELAQ